MEYTIKVQINDDHIKSVQVTTASDEQDVIRNVKQYLNSIYGYKKELNFSLMYPHDVLRGTLDIPDTGDFNRISKVVETDNEKVFYNNNGVILHRMKYKEQPPVFKIHCPDIKEVIFEEFYTYNRCGGLIHYQNSDGFECRYRYSVYGVLSLYSNSDGIIIVFDFDSDHNLFMEVHTLKGIKIINKNPYKELYPSVYDVLNNPDKVNKLIKGEE